MSGNRSVSRRLIPALVCACTEHMKAILGTKVGMTRYLDGEQLVGATVIQAEPNAVTQVKTIERDGYRAIQLGAGDAKRANKPQQGHVKKAGVEVGRRFAEFRVLDESEMPEVGSPVTVTTFSVGDIVNAQATSRGRGFAGTIKRHHFKRGPKTHGSDNIRNPGSIGATFPQRVVLGRRMGGHLGDETTTVKHLEVLAVLPEDNLIVLRGSVPGVRGANVIITGSPRHQDLASKETA